MRRRTQGDESEPLLSSMEQTPPTKEKLDATTDDAVIIPVDDASADDLFVGHCCHCRGRGRDGHRRVGSAR